MRTNRLALLGFASALLFCVPATARADEVVMKSGTTRRGKVVSVDDGYVVLETALGRIRIARSEVASLRRDEEAGAETAPDGGDPQGEPEIPGGDDPGPAARHAQPATDGGTAVAEPLDAAERLEQRRQARILRSTGPRASAEEDEPTPENAPGATIGGLDLARVAPGKEVIVFQPPRRFAAAGGAIELGRRTLARMELAGVTAAWLAVPLDAGEERIAVRLADVKRHIELGEGESRVRLLDGIGRGDWLRLRLSTGEHVQGRLAAIHEEDVEVAGLAEDGIETRTTVSLAKLVQVDGLLHNSAAHMALVEIEDGEPIAITTWPDGSEVIGRFAGRNAATLSLDTDGDGEADVTIPRRGPLADVHRVPVKSREFAATLERGTPIRAAYREELGDVVVTHELLTRVAAVTAYVVALESDHGAVIVPFDDVDRLEPIDLDRDDELEQLNRPVPAASLSCDLPLLPGAPAAEGRELAGESGVSAISDGEHVTHVFVMSPFEGQVFGIRIGDPALQAARRADLRFETIVRQRPTDERKVSRTEMLSSSVEGLRVALLVDQRGFVDAIELSAAE